MGMIIKDGQPHSIVEDEGFLYFIKIFGPNYIVPPRKAVRAMVEASFQHDQGKG